ncbi:hypothetical protein P6144_01465 [Sphingomonas sp. HITSZ_GF]|uniref:hypothetical protein n=1 Tax=Sphingomonas sp. HITSZ_GF TaxID=3037247 RepID=UPI00240E1315|nr:hypothetical protein [Sphingomonas sp. HITSZ_GF]MDG2532302.1 hypothetical protein [Sphingomonas sp. HITSZ_GF]
MAAQVIDEPGTSNKLRIAAWSAAAGLLMLPAIAMQLTHEVRWGPADFVLAALLIGGTGLVFELAIRARASGAYRAAVALALFTAFLTVWVNLAVGMIGDAGNPLNLLFGGVIAVAILGGFLARFQPVGMAWAMAATALVQAATVIPALTYDPRTAALIGAFTLPWLLSAALFRAAHGRD